MVRRAELDITSEAPARGLWSPVRLTVEKVKEGEEEQAVAKVTKIEEGKMTLESRPPKRSPMRMTIGKTRGASPPSYMEMRAQLAIMAARLNDLGAQRDLLANDLARVRDMVNRRAEVEGED